MLLLRRSLAASRTSTAARALASCPRRTSSPPPGTAVCSWGARRHRAGPLAMATAGGAAAAADPLVQFVVLRRDLRSDVEGGWPFGSVVAQACHASVAAIAEAVDAGDADALAYVHSSNVDRMHKVVKEVKDEAALRKLSDKLTGSGIQHKLWIEQPEDFATWYAAHGRARGNRRERPFARSGGPSPSPGRDGRSLRLRAPRRRREPVVGQLGQL